MSDEKMLPTIPQCDPRAGYLAQATEIDAAIHRVLAQGRYILGPEVSAFEEEFATYLGLDHSLGVGNGTDAIALALRALDIGPGDAVVTVSHTAVATVVAIRSVGANPVFVDVTAEDGLMDPTQVEALLKVAARHGMRMAAGRIRAIIPVHLYGRCADMSALCRLAERYRLPIVEDCAQAHGARFAGRTAGSFGTISAFSFYPTKNLGAIGDGGAIATSDPALFARARLLREYGWRERYISDIEGGNSRLDEIQAAILRVKLPQLDLDNGKRVALAAAYQHELHNPHVRIPARDVHNGHVYHQFAIRCHDRDGLQAHLRDQGISSLVHYPRPVHLQPAYTDERFVPLALPETERWASEVLSLPMYPQMHLEDASRVSACVNDWQPNKT